MKKRLFRKLLPKSLVGQLILWALLLTLVSIPFFQVIFTSAVSRISKDVVDTRLLEFGNQLRGHWASNQAASISTNTSILPIPNTRFSGGPDADWVWQIAVDGRVQDRSDFLLLLEQSVTPPQKMSTDAFTVQTRETEIGPMRVAERLIKDQGNPSVYFMVGIREERYQELVFEHNQRLQSLTLLFDLPVTLVVMAFLLFIVVAVRRGLSNVTNAIKTYENGETEKIEGEFAAEFSAPVEGINRLLRQNRKLVDRTRKYVSKIAHDINHPLAIMKNALSNEQINEKDRELLQSQVTRLTGLVDRYSSLARAIGPEGEVQSRTNIHEMLEDTVLGFSILYRKTPLSITQNCDESLVFPVPRHDLEAMISNLLSNAHKYAKSEAVVSAGKNDLNYWITVEDNGPGIPELQRETAINWGSRLDEAPPGTGFGLSIVRDIAELYDGSVTLGVSKLGGLKAEVALPISRS